MKEEGKEEMNEWGTRDGWEEEENDKQWSSKHRSRVLKSPQAPAFEDYTMSNLGQHLEGHFLFKKEKRYSTL